jgi:succinate dehydrogenase/fumarate reductase flavoprotein subunit
MRTLHWRRDPRWSLEKSGKTARYEFDGSHFLRDVGRMTERLVPHPSDSERSSLKGFSRKPSMHTLLALSQKGFLRQESITQLCSCSSCRWGMDHERHLPHSHHDACSGWAGNRSREAIPGLFPTGEVAGGVHGANRLGGSSLLACS